MPIAPNLAGMRLAQDRLLPTPCSLSRGGQALYPQPAMPDGSALRCRVAADTRESPIAGAPATEQQRRWRITLPRPTLFQVQSIDPEGGSLPRVRYRLRAQDR